MPVRLCLHVSKIVTSLYIGQVDVEFKGKQHTSKDKVTDWDSICRRDQLNFIDLPDNCT